MNVTPPESNDPFALQKLKVTTDVTIQRLWYTKMTKQHTKSGKVKLRETKSYSL